MRRTNIKKHTNSWDCSGRNTESEKTYKSKEIELVTQTVHRGKPGHVASLVDSIRHLKNNQYQPFGTSSKLIEEKGTLGGLLWDQCILISKPDKDILQTQNSTNRLTNTGTKIRNKIVANQIHQIYKKGIKHHDQVGLIPEKQGLLNIWRSIRVIQTDRIKT